MYTHIRVGGPLGAPGVLTGTPSFQTPMVFSKKYKLFDKSGIRARKAPS